MEPILEPGERVLWSGRPRLRDRLLALGAGDGAAAARFDIQRGFRFGCLAVGVAMFAVAAAMLWLQVRFEMMRGQTGAWTVATVVAATVCTGSTLVVLGAGPFVAYRGARRGRYLLTDRRVIVAGVDDAGEAVQELRYGSGAPGGAIEVERARHGSRVDVLFHAQPGPQSLTFVGVASGEEADRIERLLRESLPHESDRAEHHLS